MGIGGIPRYSSFAKLCLSKASGGFPDFHRGLARRWNKFQSRIPTAVSRFKGKLSEDDTVLPDFISQTYEVELYLVGEGGLILCAGDGVGTRAGIGDRRVFIDRNHSGQTGFHGDFGGRH